MAKTSKDNKPKKQKKHVFGNMFKDVLDVPEEIALDMPKITLIGNLSLDIENHKGIINYTSKEVKIKVSNGFLIARGRRLALKNISQEEVLLEGEIMQIGIVLDGNDTGDSYDDIYDFDNLDLDEDEFSESQLMAEDKTAETAAQPKTEATEKTTGKEEE